MSVEVGIGAVPRDHVVTFYERDDELIDSIVAFFASGLDRGVPAVMLGTAAHIAAVQASLAEAGLDVAAARSAGDLVTIDADEALERYRADAQSFLDDCGRLIERLLARSPRVRVFGELVDLLCKAGEINAALDLETRWNQLRTRLPFTLFCGYHIDSLVDDGNDAFADVCHLHSAIVTEPCAESHSTRVAVVSQVDHARSFPCDLASPGRARHFVADTLASWHRADLIDDASIVVAELTTNAVMHARSEFIVTITDHDGTVRISVRDADPALPTVQNRGLSSISGRGLVLVDTVAQRWGTERVGDGKVVWAELHR